MSRRVLFSFFHTYFFYLSLVVAVSLSGFYQMELSPARGFLVRFAMLLPAVALLSQGVINIYCKSRMEI